MKTTHLTILLHTYTPASSPFPLHSIHSITTKQHSSYSFHSSSIDYNKSPSTTHIHTLFYMNNNNTTTQTLQSQQQYSSSPNTHSSLHIHSIKNPNTSEQLYQSFNPFYNSLHFNNTLFSFKHDHSHRGFHIERGVSRVEACWWMWRVAKCWEWMD